MILAPILEVVVLPWLAWPVFEIRYIVLIGSDIV